MSVTSPTIQQIERALNKVAAKFSMIKTDPVLTDIHLQIKPESGELLVYNDDFDELTRCVVEEWIDSKDENFYETNVPVLRKCIQGMQEVWEKLPILKPFSFVLIDEDQDVVSDLYLVDDDTIILDKTGTITRAHPTVAEIVPFNQESREELLGLAACLEEHFPHSMARAVVREAQKRGIDHEERHSKVEYIVAHGISSMVDGSRVVIGSYHFAFEDEGCQIPEGMGQRLEGLPEEYSHLYMAVDGKLAAVICIEDPLREEAADVVASLKKSGFRKIVMMTGDSERTARSIALKAGVDEYYSEVLPEDKAAFVEKEREEGKKVVMVGDGMNDSPALSAADAGIAISDGAQLAREIADITVDADHLSGLVDLKSISDRLAVRIRKNYFGIIGINSMLILLGAGGLIQPTVSAFVHNASMLAISLNSMKNLLD